MADLGLLYDDRFLDHDTGPGHPERADRLIAVRDRLAREDLISATALISPRVATIEELARVHAMTLIDSVRTAAQRAPALLDADTPVSSASFETAVLAVGGVLQACDAVVEGRARRAFCAVRPPGHHAEHDRAMGFCLFNNVAVAARHLQVVHGMARVAIIDWDVHHGNGTQHVFEADGEVFYASIHQHPLYPGTGLRSEQGVGAGRGTTLNIPLPAGSTDADYQRAFEDIEEAIDSFRPDVLLISAGYDAHNRDPLASMLVTEQGFGGLAHRTRLLADHTCGGRLVLVLEGGYDLEGLAASVAATMRVLV